MSLQWKDRQKWREITWPRRMSEGRLEAHANELLARAQSFGDRQQWDQYNDCRNALFMVRSEQQRRRNQCGQSSAAPKS